jgi:hypothetical protein
MSEEEFERTEEFEEHTWRATERAAPLGMEYLDEQPESLPDDGQVLVHNVAYAGQPSGDMGFRFWLAAPNPDRQQPCSCAFAPAIAQHYRTRFPGTTK